MKKNQILAFDFGASSGRAMLSRIEDGKMVIEEIHRFSNDPVLVNGHLYWDVLRLFHEIKQGISKATNAGGFDSIGIDTWGVDYGLLDKDGQLIGNPYNYRDIRTDGMQEEFYKKMSKETLYAETGIQQVDLNTVYQLQAAVKYRPQDLEQAQTLLLMPDLFAYFLTGAKRIEYTNASTTGLLDPNTKD
ncbi:MAG: FGGY family carbohydrate kinase, partial [Acutalibacteraceae bacterium]|nr:FGGY family carbohydrate kinase [Acutalibacteraceae bacterium]